MPSASTSTRGSRRSVLHEPECPCADGLSSRFAIAASENTDHLADYWDYFVGPMRSAPAFVVVQYRSGGRASPTSALLKKDY